MKNDAIQRRAGGVKLSSLMFCAAAVAAWLPATGLGQVNSGSVSVMSVNTKRLSTTAKTLRSKR